MPACCACVVVPSPGSACCVAVLQVHGVAPCACRACVVVPPVKLVPSPVVLLSMCMVWPLTGAVRGNLGPADIAV